MKLVGHVVRIGKKGNTDGFLMLNPEGKKSPGWPCRKWGDNIKIDLKEM
jgi:hypothetical protein